MNKIKLNFEVQRWFTKENLEEFKKDLWDFNITFLDDGEFLSVVGNEDEPYFSIKISYQDDLDLCSKISHFILLFCERHSRIWEDCDDCIYLKK